MVKSLYTGVSGMKTHQQKMDVIGNNIANVNTTGYKTNVVTFADVYYQTKKSPSGASTTLGGVNPTQVGYGVKMNTTTPNMTQSGFTFSDSIYDMAIDGRNRRYYKITSVGIAQLSLYKEEWKQYSQRISGIFEGGERV